MRKETEMETGDLDRIRFVTRHFHHLQGLRLWMPAGMVSLGAAGLASSVHPALSAAGIVLILGAFVLMLGARRYYRREFGEVEQQPVRVAVQVSSLSIFSPAGLPQLTGSRHEISVEERLTIVMAVAVGAMVVFQLLFWPPWIKLGAQVIFEPSGIFVQEPEWSAQAFPSPLLTMLLGAFFFAVWLARERRLSQGYHPALGLVLLGLAALPVTAHLWAALLFSGVALVLAGALDHRQLVRALGRPAQEEEL
jgi:hypothetical protein